MCVLLGCEGFDYYCYKISYPWWEGCSNFSTHYNLSQEKTYRSDTINWSFWGWKVTTNSHQFTANTVCSHDHHIDHLHCNMYLISLGHIYVCDQILLTEKFEKGPNISVSVGNYIYMCTVQSDSYPFTIQGRKSEVRD